MAEAKRLYDEAVAESGQKRAGMRSSVVPLHARRGAARAGTTGPRGVGTLSSLPDADGDEDPEELDDEE